MTLRGVCAYNAHMPKYPSTTKRPVNLSLNSSVARAAGVVARGCGLNLSQFVEQLLRERLTLPTATSSQPNKLKK